MRALIDSQLRAADPSGVTVTAVGSEVIAIVLSPNAGRASADAIVAQVLPVDAAPAD